MKTETPFMLLFVCNRMDQASIISDTKQMLDTALYDIEQHGMLAQEFENKDIPNFTLRLNIPRLPAAGENKSSSNKDYDHHKGHGKRAFRFEVAKEDIDYFKYLSAHAHQMKLEVKYFGKFAKYTATLGNATPLSGCTSLRQCIQGHLNYHLSSTSITLTGIDKLYAAECIRHPSGRSIIRLTLWELLYRINLENDAPLFLQLSQQPTEEVDAVIPNTAEAEAMAEQMYTNIAAWCNFYCYWNDINPGVEKFYRKLSERAFSQVLRHEISACTWDPTLKIVTSPKGQSEMASLAEFEQLELVKMLTQGGTSLANKQDVQNDPNVAFNFQDDFSVGRIHGNNTSQPQRKQWQQFWQLM